MAASAEYIDPTLRKLEEPTAPCIGRMDALQIIEAYCAGCADARPHSVIDAGSCRCQDCGKEQPLR